MLAERGLRGRREDRLGQPAAVLEPRRQRDAADLAGGAVVEQPGAGEVAAGDALDRDTSRAARRSPPGRAPPSGTSVESTWCGTRSASWSNHHSDIRVRISPLSGIGGVEDEVEGRDAVAGDHQQPAVGQLVEVAHLAGVEVRRSVDASGAAGVGMRRGYRPCGLPGRQYLMSNAVAPVGRASVTATCADRRRTTGRGGTTRPSRRRRSRLPRGGPRPSRPARCATQPVTPSRSASCTAYHRKDDALHATGHLRPSPPWTCGQPKERDTSRRRS